MTLPTDTMTFLCTDIENSTRLWEQHPEAMEEALTRHDALVRQAIGAHGGHVFKALGDGFYAAFPTAREAMEAAITAQYALQAEPWPMTPGLRTRAALYTGAAYLRDNDYFGSALNRLERLVTAGHGGQTLVGHPTGELIREFLPPGAELRDLGLHRLKGFQNPERIYHLVLPGLPADFPPLRSLEAFDYTLPLPLTSFIGREQEIAEVKHLLTGTRLLTLAGPGGCGKTRLATQVGLDLEDRYPDGAALVELASITDDNLLPQSFATALNVREEPGRPLTETLVNTLRPKSVFLIVDNCEHIVARCARLVQTLLQSCPNLHVLATSREPLGIAGETAWEVPALECPDLARMPSLEKLAQMEAVRLFVERASARTPGFVLTEIHAAAVAQICHRMDGMPLAIELAAAQIRVLTPQQIASLLDQSLALLQSAAPTTATRQRTLEGALDWSYQLLSEEEKRLLRGLGVFLGGWTLEAAHAVCLEESGDLFSVLNLLSSLVNKSLVAVDEQNGANRYRLLETIRQFSLSRLARSGEEMTVRERHLDFYRGLAEQAEPYLTGADQALWLDRLQAEHSNLRAALEWTAGSAEARMRLAGRLYRFYAMRQHPAEGRALLEGTLARCAHVPDALKAKVLNGLGLLAYRQTDYRAAHAYLEDSVRLWRGLRDDNGAAEALTNLGNLERDTGKYREAHAHLTESLEIWKRTGDRWRTAAGLTNLGRVARDLGDAALTRSCYEEALAIFREFNDTAQIASLLSNLGGVLYDQEDYASARPLFEESLTMFRDLQHPWGSAVLLYNLGQVVGRLDGHQAAIPYFRESLEQRVALGDTAGACMALAALGRMAAQAGEFDRGVTLFSAAERHRRQTGAKISPADRKSRMEMIAAREAMGKREFTAAWTRGKAMPFDKAVENAMLG